jgi:hypothetical protein
MQTYVRISQACSSRLKMARFSNASRVLHAEFISCRIVGQSLTSEGGLFFDLQPCSSLPTYRLSPQVGTRHNQNWLMDFNRQSGRATILSLSLLTNRVLGVTFKGQVRNRPEPL